MRQLEEELQGVSRLTGRAIDHLTTVVSGVAFWTGIVAPLSYLMFVIPGVRTGAGFSTLLVLIAIHYLALILGYPHYRSET